MQLTKQRLLADFLRRRRRDFDGPVAERLSRRRPPSGLSRGELAERAGVSVDWIARIEQARSVTVSRTTARRLAQALNLDRVERDHLLALTDPDAEAIADDRLASATTAIIDGCVPMPAYAINPLADVVHRNRAADLIFSGFEAPGDGGRPNLLSFWFLNERASSRVADWRSYAVRLARQFRLNHDQALGAPAFAALADRLCRESPVFADMWCSHRVDERSAGRKHLSHPDFGPLSFEYTSFHPVQQPSFTVTIMAPADDLTAGAMDRACRPRG